MASIIISGTLLDPSSKLAIGDEVRFTHKTTTGSTIQSAQSSLTIGVSGAYSIELQFGLILVEYKDHVSTNFKNLGVVTVNQDSTATSLPELLNAIVPPTDAQLLEFQAILADCVTEADRAETEADRSETAASVSEAFANQLTTTELIASVAIYAADVNIGTSGFLTSGDIGSGNWLQNGVTAQPVSQSPAQLDDALLNDANGNQWALVGQLTAAKLGAVGGVDEGVILAALISAAESRGHGTRIFMNRPVSGEYQTSIQLNVNKGIWFDFEGFGDESSAGTPNDGLMRIKWVGAAGGIIFKWGSSTLGNKLFYGGFTGSVMLDGNNLAATCFKGVSLQGFNSEILYTYRPTGFGVLLNNENEALLSNVHFDVLRHFNGANVLAENGKGLYIDGDQWSGAATSIFVNEYEAEYDKADALTFAGVDTCYFGRVRTIARGGSYIFGGTSTGEGVRFKKSVTANIHASKNFIAHLGRGTVFVEDDTVANKVGFFNGEGGAVQFEGGANRGTFFYECVDRIHGDIFETHSWAMQERKDVNVLSMVVAAGTPAIVTAGSFPLPYYAFSPSATETLVGVLPPPDKWNNGNIIGYRIALVPVGSTSPNDVAINVKLSAMVSGDGPGSGDLSENRVYTISGTTTVVDLEERIFATPLGYTKNATIAIIVSRLGADVADTFPNDLGIAAFQLIYESDGPDSGGTGPWEVSDIS